MSNDQAGTAKFPTIRLTKGMRDTITKALCNHAFDKPAAALKAREHALFELALNDLIGAKERERMSRLPKGWLLTTDYLYINAGGWHIKVRGKTARPVPYDMDRHNGRTSIKTAALAAKIQEWAQSQKRHEEESSALRRQIESLLLSCTTVGAFYKAMPDAEVIVGKLITAPVRNTALVTTAEQIMCRIAQARGDQRDGCDAVLGTTP